MKITAIRTKHLEVDELSQFDLSEKDHPNGANIQFYELHHEKIVDLFLQIIGGRPYGDTQVILATKDFDPPEFSLMIKRVRKPGD